MKSRLAPIVTGEYIMSPMINFISEAMVEKEDNLVNSIFRTPGIISSYDIDGEYDNSLMVVAGVNNNIIIKAGSFVDRSGKILSVPDTITDINVNQLNKIFIRYAQSIYVPDVTISANAGDFNIVYSSSSVLDYITPGMSVMTEAMYKAGATQGYKVVSVGTFITVESAIPVSFANQRLIVIPKFLTGSGNIDSSCLYRFDSYQIIDEASLAPGQTVSDDWILLATISFEEGQYQINNIRVSSDNELSDETNAIFNFLPNVASLATAFSDSMEYYIKKFFTEGELSIGGITKEIYRDSHEQNTDTGTVHGSFDIHTTNGIFRIGDTEQEDYLIRLFSEVSTPRSYELPNTPSLVKDSTKVTLVAKDLPTQFEAMIGTKSQDVMLNNSMLELPSNSNVFNVSGAGDLRVINISGDAVTHTGQLIILKFNSRVAVVSGGNIISNFLTSSSNDPNAFFIESGETLSLVNVGYSFYLASAPITSWRAVSDIKQMLESLELTVTNNKQAFDDYVSNTAETLANIEATLVEHSSELTVVTTDIQNIKLVVNNHDTNIQSLTGRIGAAETNIINLQNADITLQSAIDVNATNISQLQVSITSVNQYISSLNTRVLAIEQKLLMYSKVPRGTILPLNINSADVLSGFSATGLGLEDTEFEGFAICNGNNGTPRLAGRSLMMATDFGITSGFNSGSSSNFRPSGSGWTGWSTLEQPPINLGDYFGMYRRPLTMFHIPKHVHMYLGDDQLSTFMEDQSGWMLPGMGYSADVNGYDATSHTGSSYYSKIYTTSFDAEVISWSQFRVLSYRRKEASFQTEDIYSVPPSYAVLFIMKVR